MVDGSDKQDRVLVRPYVKNDDEEPLPQPAPDPRTSAETQVIPQIEAAPVPPAPSPSREEHDRRGILWLVGGALALILVTVVVMVAVWPRGGDEDALPATDPVWPAGTPAGSAAAPTSAGVSAAASKATTSQSASASASPSVTPSQEASASPSATPSASASAAPAVDRTGKITGAGGHCLDVKGEIALLGSSLSVYPCNGTLSQTWTLATDGSLKVAGMCAAASGSTSVHVSTCGSDKDGHWLAGSGGTLVNQGNGNCLADGETGASLRLATCGGSGQSWALP